MLMESSIVTILSEEPCVATSPQVAQYLSDWVKECPIKQEIPLSDISCPLPSLPAPFKPALVKFQGAVSGRVSVLLLPNAATKTPPALCVNFSATTKQMQVGWVSSGRTTHWVASQTCP